MRVAHTESQRTIIVRSTSGAVLDADKPVHPVHGMHHVEITGESPDMVKAHLADTLSTASQFASDTVIRILWTCHSDKP